MAKGRRCKDELAYSSSARRDVRAWGMFVIGVIFVVSAYNIDPQTNCSADGTCAPWLIPIAFVLGALVGLGGLGMLIANPKRGSRIDPDTGDLIWWQNRHGATGGDEGRIAPEAIGMIRIDRRSEGKNELHLYDQTGVRQFYFDEEVIGCDPDRWAEAMRKRWPRIAIKVVD